MFGVLSRSVARRAVIQPVRYIAQKPPSSPSPKNDVGSPPATDALNAAPETSTEKPELDLSASTHTTPIIGGVPSLDFSPAEPGQEPKRTGARSAKGTLSSAERRRRNAGRAFMTGIAVAFGAYTVYLGRPWNEDDLKAKKLTLEQAPATRWGRTRERFMDIFDFFNKPAWPELLPPPYPPPHGKPYTLLVSIDDLLVTSTWDRQHGWRTAKRPGVDYFLAYISQFYEVVIFTTQNYYTALPVLEKLDRYNFYITHKLFREATRSINGKIVKDLSYLNRDLSKVILLETDPDHISTHPENAIVIPKWKGDPKDRGLVAMIPFLESIAIYKANDVRPILQAYAGKNIPLEYAQKEAEAKTKHIEEWQMKRGVSTGAMGSWFGLSSQATRGQRSQIPPTYLEQKRFEAQMQYREEQKYIAEHKDELERLLKQEQDAMAGETPSSLWEAIDHLTGTPKKNSSESSAPPDLTAATPPDSLTPSSPVKS